jgi:pimeloyl-ACP methyl ester carboxylesterase
MATINRPPVATGAHGALPPDDAGDQRYLPRRRYRAHVVLLIVGLATSGLAAVCLHTAEARISRDEFTIPGAIPVPALRFTPTGHARNVVAVVAHGFSGSKELMASFGIERARQDITAYCFDFPGHGASPVAFGGGGGVDAAVTERLIATVGEVADYALAHTPSPGAKLVLIGHSMDTSAVGLYALRRTSQPNLAAMVLVSPVLGESPAPGNPRNLLILSGEFDLPGIIIRSRELFAAACGGSVPTASVSVCRTDAPRENPSGSIRLAILPGLNHISILTASATHEEMLTSWVLASSRASLRVRWMPTQGCAGCC